MHDCLYNNNSDYVLNTKFYFTSIEPNKKPLTERGYFVALFNAFPAENY